jgi:hypothetical protein
MGGTFTRLLLLAALNGTPAVARQVAEGSSEQASALEAAHASLQQITCTARQPTGDRGRMAPPGMPWNRS